jgi:hypothetical protein
VCTETNIAIGTRRTPPGGQAVITHGMECAGSSGNELVNAIRQRALHLQIYAVALVEVCSVRSRFDPGGLHFTIRRE